MTDENQNITALYQSDTWGNELLHQVSALNPQPPENPYRWNGASGYYWDADSEMFLLGMRWYDAGTGKFVSRDPIGFADDATSVTRYGHNNPTNILDPNGEAGLAAAAPALGAAAAILAVALACAVPHFITARKKFKGARDKFLHCWVSCRTAKVCGGILAEIAGLEKEILDTEWSALCEFFPQVSICRTGAGLRHVGEGIKDSLGDLLANQQCIGWETFAFGAVGGWIGTIFRDSCEQCCRKKVGY
jgi:RHS repeat-associated protein